MVMQLNPPGRSSLRLVRFSSAGEWHSMGSTKALVWLNHSTSHFSLQSQWKAFPRKSLSREKSVGDRQEGRVAAKRITQGQLRVFWGWGGGCLSKLRVTWGSFSGQPISLPCHSSHPSLPPPSQNQETSSPRSLCNPGEIFRLVHQNLMMQFWVDVYCLCKNLR